MSFLVAMARAHYHDNAFDAFTASSGYSLENARAMMWMSQLAYDTDEAQGRKCAGRLGPRTAGVRR